MDDTQEVDVEPVAPKPPERPPEWMSYVPLLSKISAGQYNRERRDYEFDVKQQELRKGREQDHFYQQQQFFVGLQKQRDDIAGDMNTFLTAEGNAYLALQNARREAANQKRAFPGATPEMTAKIDAVVQEAEARWKMTTVPVIQGKQRLSTIDDTIMGLIPNMKPPRQLSAGKSAPSVQADAGADPEAVAAPDVQMGDGEAPVEDGGVSAFDVPDDPMRDNADLFRSHGFDDVVSDGRSITVNTNSSEDADRARELLKTLAGDTFGMKYLPSLVKIVDNEAEGMKNFALSEAIDKQYKSAVNSASRYGSAMLPTAKQSDLLEYAKQAAEEGEKEQARQLTSMASADVNARKAFFTPYLELETERVDLLKEERDMMRGARRKYVKSRGIPPGMIDDEPAPRQKQQAAATPPPGMDDNYALMWWAKQNGYKTSDLSNPDIAVAFSDWLTAYKSKK